MPTPATKPIQYPMRQHEVVYSILRISGRTQRREGTNKDPQPKRQIVEAFLSLNQKNSEKVLSLYGMGGITGKWNVPAHWIASC